MFIKSLRYKWLCFKWRYIEPNRREVEEALSIYQGTSDSIVRVMIDFVYTPNLDIDKIALSLNRPRERIRQVIRKGVRRAWNQYLKLPQN